MFNVIPLMPNLQEVSTDFKIAFAVPKSFS